MKDDFSFRRFRCKHLKQEFNEIGYRDKLSAEDRLWLDQFLFEYYQGDFNFETPLHPKELRKDCMDRNNSSKRQIHSVGSNILWEAARKALNIRNGTNNMQKARFYSHLDYIKEINYQPEIDEEPNS